MPCLHTTVAIPKKLSRLRKLHKVRWDKTISGARQTLLWNPHIVCLATSKIKHVRLIPPYVIC